MARKQRLALAISSTLSLLMGTGCSTTSTVKTSVMDDTSPEVIVRHISYQKPSLRSRQQNKLSRESDRVRQERQLDDEINALALKLGLGSHSASVGFIKEKKKTFQTKIKPAVYHPKYKTIHKVVARREISFKPDTSSGYSDSFEREVNRLYASDNPHLSSATQLKRNSIWSQIKAGYRLDNETQNFIVQRVLTEYARNPERLNRIFSRSSKYLYFIINELKRRGMPTELALLPMVESGYINTETPSTDTAGLWQLRTVTGKRLGLKTTHDYDERLDVFSSTRAALTHLQKLYKEFHGDWYLALAAYNAGSARIHQERKKNRRQGLGTDYWSLNLPLETREYVPRLLAYKEILNRSQSYNLKLPKAPNKVTLVQADVNKSVDLRHVADKAGLPKLFLTGLNPALKDGVTKPQLSRKIVVPKEFIGNLYESIKRTPSITPVTRIVKYTPKHTNAKIYRVAKKSKVITKSTINYHIQSGDNLYKIALKHGTTVAKLMRLNKMKDSRLRAGEHLKIVLKGALKGTAKQYSLKSHFPKKVAGV